VRIFKRPFAYVAITAFCAASGFSAPVHAQDAEASKPATYVVTYQCQSGQFARIVTHDQKLSEALEQLSKGAITAAQVLDYVSQNAAKELDKTILFLDVCVGVKFRRT
jgi:hypothetical protein